MSELGTKVYALSLDDVDAQAAFVKAQELNFTLLSDPDGSAAEKYGVLAGKRRFTRRVTFVIDNEGVLRHIDERVKVDSHGADLAAVIRNLQS